MAKKLWFGFLVLVLIIPVLLTSCTSTTSTSTSQSATTSVATSKIATTSTESQTSTATQANWWDKFGQPKYGGAINVAVSGFRGISYDVVNPTDGNIPLWYDALFGKSWTVDRAKWSFDGMYTPEEYIVGNLVDTWEWTDPTTLTVRLHQGVKFQNKAPVNGRELTSEDVVTHYDRLMGTGHGYTQPLVFWASTLANWEKVTAVDKYTITFKFKTVSVTNFTSVSDPSNLNDIEAPEWVALGGPPSNAPSDNGGGPGGGGPGGPPAQSTGPLTDWKLVVGTGPWMLTDFVSGSTLTYQKNPDYWGTDPRYPQNKIPYADTLNSIIIPDASTRIAAMRTGKVDVVTVNWQQAAQLIKTNPDLSEKDVPVGSAGVTLIANKKPFTDIRVRQALEMAIDRQAIAKSIYGGTARSTPSGLITQTYSGYCFSYEDWPQELKDAYSYNPTAAKKLLAEAGFADGFKTNVVAGTNSDFNLLQAFKAYFLEVGIDMEIKTVDGMIFGQYKINDKCDQMSYDGGAMTMAPNMDIQNIYSKTIYAPAYGAYDAKYDALVEKYMTAPNSAEAAQILQDLDQYYLTQHWQVLGPEYYDFILWPSYLKGYSGENLEFWGCQNQMAAIWLEKN